MSDKITHDSILHTIFENIDDNTDRLDPPELERLKGNYEDRWINANYPDKAQYDMREKGSIELWELLQKYKRNAFTVGFEAATALWQNGGTA